MYQGQARIAMSGYRDAMCIPCEIIVVCRMQFFVYWKGSLEAISQFKIVEM